MTIFNSSFKQSNVNIKTLDSYTLLSSPNIEQQIDKHWDIKLAYAKENSKKLWNSKIYRIDKLDINDNKLTITLSESDYKTVQTSFKLKDQYLKLGEKYYPKGGLVTTLIELSDNNYTFGELSGKSMMKGKYGIVGGSLNMNEKSILNSKDLFDYIKMEIKEEINIDDYDIKELRIIGAILTDDLHIAIIFHTKLNLNTNELLKKFNKQHDFEFKSIKVVPSNNIKAFFKQNFKGWVIDIANLKYS